MLTPRRFMAILSSTGFVLDCSDRIEHAWALRLSSQGLLATLVLVALGLPWLCVCLPVFSGGSLGSV
eukprot:623249-Hanusia_phi.AAC.1